MRTDSSIVLGLHRDPTSYNPYALDVVPFSAVEPDDFYTMSVRGVTHYVNGLTQDFTSLDQWEREYQLFNAMCTLTVHAGPLAPSVRTGIRGALSSGRIGVYRKQNNAPRLNQCERDYWFMAYAQLRI